MGRNAGSGNRGVEKPQRFSVRRKQEAILQLLRGETLEEVSRSTGVTAAQLSNWRDRFLSGGCSALRSREPDCRDEEIERLHSKIGELTMDNELLAAKADRLEGRLPLPTWRSKK